MEVYLCTKFHVGSAKSHIGNNRRIAETGALCIQPFEVKLFLWGWGVENQARL